MREVYAPNLGERVVIVTFEKVRYLAAKGLVVNQKTTKIG